MCNTVMHFVVFFSVAHIDGGMAIEQDWWKNKLAEDIYATLRFKEQTLPAFKVQAEFASSHVCNHCQLSSFLACEL